MRCVCETCVCVCEVSVCSLALVPGLAQLRAVPPQVEHPADSLAVALGAGAGDGELPPGSRQGAVEHHQDVVGLLGPDGLHPLHGEGWVVHLGAGWIPETM